MVTPFASRSAALGWNRRTTSCCRVTIVGQSSATSPVTVPKRPACRTTWCIRPALTRAFLGIQPRLTQVPPRGPRSMSATRAFSASAVLTALMPAAPPPMTTRSKPPALTLLAVQRRERRVVRDGTVAARELFGRDAGLLDRRDERRLRRRELVSEWRRARAPDVRHEADARVRHVADQQPVGVRVAGEQVRVHFALPVAEDLLVGDLDDRRAAQI